jgi:hypothetical protein
MPKKSAAHQKKVDEAVRILNTTTGVIVPQAMIMILAGFPKKDIANETVRRMIRRRLEALEAKQKPLLVVVVTNNDADLSTLTCEDDDPTASATTTTTTTGPVQHPKPKRKQIRHTARAIQQSRVDNLAAKRHKSDAHKAAVRLFQAEKQKPDGMSIRMVYDAITAKYETCPSIATISRYAKQGFTNASPMRMSPFGHILAVAYKFLCQAYKSLVPINQMNACAGDNSRAKMIPIFAKTFSIRTVKATGLLNRVIRDTATDINCEKMNCAEDRRIRWTTYQNLDLWFDSWETFLVKYGFTTINKDGSLHITEEMKARILNFDETCLSLDRSKSNQGGRPTVTYYDVRFPQLGKARSKSALTTIRMISGSSAAGESIPPTSNSRRRQRLPRVKRFVLRWSASCSLLRVFWVGD